MADFLMLEVELLDRDGRLDSILSTSGIIASGKMLQSVWIENLRMHSSVYD